MSVDMCHRECAKWVKDWGQDPQTLQNGMVGRECENQQDSGSEYVVHGSIASASPDNLLDIHILHAHTTPTDSETLGLGPKPCFNKLFS